MVEVGKKEYCNDRIASKIDCNLQ